MISRILITGAQGFSARALRDLLSRDHNCELFLTDRYKNSSFDEVIVCDLSSPEDVHSLLEKTRPCQIYHLAGTFTNDYETDYKANVISAKNLLDSLLTLNWKPRILLVGSASEYGSSMNSVEPVCEERPLFPVSIYGLSKVFQTSLMKYYFSNYSLDLVMARPFNLFGKGISNRLFVGKLYEQINEYRLGKTQKIIVGNLQSKRDYLHVTSAVRDYQVIMAKGHAGEIYNVGSGFFIKIETLLDRILREEGLDWSVVEEKDYSSSSVAISIADVTKIEQLKIRK